MYALIFSVNFVSSHTARSSAPSAYANSSRARCAIYSRDTTNPHLQHPTINMQKSVCQNLIMGQSYESCIIFLPASLMSRFSNMANILGKTLCSGPRRRPGRHAHVSKSLAPRHHVRCSWDLPRLINSSRRSFVRNNERYLAFSPAVTRAYI
jgi:hypothetical protein